MKNRIMAALIGSALAMGAAPGNAQPATDGPVAAAGAKAATIERIKVHAPTIQGNLEGDAADRDVLVLLPPSYGREPARRYPVIYALHGYTLSAEQWTKDLNVPTTAQNAFAKGAREMIVVSLIRRLRITGRCIHLR
jgi:enterochelin esterase-like enzyme